jgi:hypothetical protein
MALVPTLNLRQFRDYDGQVTLQQMFWDGGVVPIWKDVPVADYYDEAEVRRRNAEQARKAQATGSEKGMDVVS